MSSTVIHKWVTVDLINARTAQKQMLREIISKTMIDIADMTVNERCFLIESKQERITRKRLPEKQQMHVDRGLTETGITSNMLREQWLVMPSEMES